MNTLLYHHKTDGGAEVILCGPCAAAADLLEACKGLLTLIKRIDKSSPPDDDTWMRADEVEQARAAIAKAEGEGATQ